MTQLPTSSASAGPMATEVSSLVRPQPFVRHLEAALVLVWLVPLGILAVITLFHSLSWRMELDTPLAHYSAFLQREFGVRPYQDLFEISFPGTLMLHLAITKLAGYGDFGFMLVNFLWLVTLGVATWLLLQPFGRLIQAAMLVIFGGAYLGYGREMPLQRDCVLILPVVLALWVLTAQKLQPRMRRVVIGLLVGVASTIKPHAAIGLLPILAYELQERAAEARLSRAQALEIVRTLSLYAAGFVTPFAIMFTWLVSNHGFAAWLEMTQSYLPLYLSLSDEHETILPGARFAYLLKNENLMGGNLAWCFAAGVGMLLALTRTTPGSPRRALVLLLALEAVAFAIYPSLSGQYWDYHFVPLVYFMCVLCALCLLPAPETASTAERLMPKLALCFSLLTAAHFPAEITSWFEGTERVGPGRGHVDEVASYLSSKLEPGDTVQPLDWTDGAVHAMLIARARLATRFMYDYHFYHHVSNPFIQELRRRFMADFNASKPRFVVDWFTSEMPTGDDTTTEFAALRQVLEEDYRVVRDEPAYRIYERVRVASSR